MSTPSLHQLKRAVEISEQIEALQVELSNLLHGSTSAKRESAEAVEAPGSAPAPTRKRRGRGKGKKTIAAIEAVADEPAAEAPVVKRRGRPPGSGKKAKAAPPAKKKGGMSPEGRARIAEAQKARWAALREK